MPYTLVLKQQVTHGSNRFHNVQRWSGIYADMANQEGIVPVIS
ncbi:hypothetical protein GPLA_1801 [Paraglaciecola polaris LMG 21857]|uniref:Uncharacterized protein n=1 Tax=Paraglaciecola polaris LMG 21857 TaxID=1129793 RepID=K6Z980_9ALTE|nr:hypothetical protein GPLA_1801 [Paraglaciecola polaris LMG 21857]